MVSVTDRKGFIYGTEGHIEVENINNYEEFRIYNNQYELTETIRRPEQLTGYEYEVRACHRALLKWPAGMRGDAACTYYENHAYAR